MGVRFRGCGGARSTIHPCPIQPRPFDCQARHPVCARAAGSYPHTTQSVRPVGSQAGYAGLPRHQIPDVSRRVVRVACAGGGPRTLGGGERHPESRRGNRQRPACPRPHMHQDMGGARPFMRATPVHAAAKYDSSASPNMRRRSSSRDPLHSIIRESNHSPDRYMERFISTCIHGTGLFP